MANNQQNNLKNRLVAVILRYENETNSAAYHRARYQHLHIVVFYLRHYSSRVVPNTVQRFLSLGLFYPDIFSELFRYCSITAFVDANDE